MKKTKPVIVIHGGAGSKRPKGQQAEIYNYALTEILTQSHNLLTIGATAVEVATFAVSMLEDSPLFNAGYGSKIQSDGKIRMSAALMDGKKEKFSGVINIQGIKNPIELCKILQNEEDRVLCGEGATKFARKNKLKFQSPYTKEQREIFKQKVSGKTGTVGAVVLDQNGRIAAATSTGGRGFEFPGRVSDSATVAGNYANYFCGVSATGIGEQIVDNAVASQIVCLSSQNKKLNSVVTNIINRAKKRDESFGVIALDIHGNFACKTSTEFMYWGVITSNKIIVNPQI